MEEVSKEGLGVPPSGSGSRPSDGAASSGVSTADAASIPNAGAYVIYDDGWSRGSRYVARRVAKVTPKLIKLERGGYGSHIPREKAIAFVDEPDRAQWLCQCLASLDGEFQRRREGAEADCKRRVDEARAAKGRGIARLLAASGIEARSDETAQQAQPAGREPGPKGDAQPISSSEHSGEGGKGK